MNRRMNARRVYFVRPFKNRFAYPDAGGAGFTSFSVTSSGDVFSCKANGDADPGKLYYDSMYGCYVTPNVVNELMFMITALEGASTESANLRIGLIDVDTGKSVSFQPNLKDDGIYGTENDIIPFLTASGWTNVRGTKYFVYNADSLAGTHHHMPGSESAWLGIVRAKLTRPARIAVALFEIDTVGIGAASLLQTDGDVPGTYGTLPADQVEYSADQSYAKMNYMDLDMGTFEQSGIDDPMTLPLMDAAQVYIYHTFVDAPGYTPVESNDLEWDYSGA